MKVLAAAVVALLMVGCTSMGGHSGFHAKCHSMEKAHMCGGRN